ncbi:hypothetical protein K502DRAFT_366389 [Neoconidiobolus thromboides FSU 785]|nr:hypothetical protein K502DRAFT_366389 [Neoconidiobolus thromboides FSU 785]
MDFQSTLSSAFTSQLYMLALPVSIYLVMKLIGYVANRLISQDTLNKWFKPKEEKEHVPEKPKRPKLNTGPYIDKPSEEEPYLPNNINPLIQIIKRQNQDRGLTESGWLKSHHTFQFGKYIDDRYIGHGSLRVFNEDFISPGKGFPQLLRKDFEIVTIVLKGTLNHYDSIDNNLSLDAGSCQLMTCGNGIKHLEENGSYDDTLQYLQLWFAPSFSDLESSYSHKKFDFEYTKNKMIPLISPYHKVDKVPITHIQVEDEKSKKNKIKNDKGETKTEVKEVKKELENETKIKNTLGINSDSYIYYSQLEPGKKVICEMQNGTKRKGYVHHISDDDSSSLLSINYEQRLKPGDGAFIGGLTDVESLEFKNLGDSNAFKDKATSENLPSGQEDIALNLEISDQIRSKTFNPKDVITSLRRRLRHANPNVQLLALTLADTCVKNAGDLFLKELASREFMDDLVSILKHPGGINPQVKTRLLESIQSWSISFKGRSDLIYTSQIFGALKAQGYIFPPPESLSSAMIDTKIAPEWTDSEVCMRCRTAFTFTNRKHHCRNCGQTFCQTCSSNSVPLPHFGINDPVRVCTGCYLGLKRVNNDSTSLSLSEFISTETPPNANNPETKANNYADMNSSDFDADLRKAIELSLTEAKKNASDKETYIDYHEVKKPEINQEEDPDLAAAIAASLKDMEISQHRVNNNSNYLPDEITRKESFKPELPHFNLSDKELQNLSLFSKLIETIDLNHGRIDPSIHNLYADISSLAPKLALSINDSTYKHGHFTDLQNKLSSAVKMYDSLLEKSMYKRHYGLSSTPNSNHYTYGTAPTAPINQFQHSVPSSYIDPSRADGNPHYPHHPAGHAPSPHEYNYHSAETSSHYPSPGAPSHPYNNTPSNIPSQVAYQHNPSVPRAPIHPHYQPDSSAPSAPSYYNHSVGTTPNSQVHPAYPSYQPNVPGTPGYHENPAYPQAATNQHQDPNNHPQPQSAPQDTPLIEL